MFYHIILIIFILAVGIQLGFVVHLRCRKFKNSSTPANTPNVSVIICAKNEALNLQQFLSFVLDQDYPKTHFEVIVVNDQSTDNTEKILLSFQEKYDGLKIVTISENVDVRLPGKKHALAKGIAAATHDRLLLTDADCRPSSNQWLKEMVQIEANIILGYGAYEVYPGWLNKFIRWETAHTCMQYASYAKAGMAYMGVGRNLSYCKSSLESLEQDLAFQQIYSSLPSGDDDLLISRIAQHNTVALCLNKNAHTISIPKKTWKTWWLQKTRHMSTGKFYPVKIKNLLGLYALSHSLYWFCGLFFVAMPLTEASPPPLYYLVLILFVLRLSLFWYNALNWYKQLDEKKLLYFYPLGDFGWALYNVILSPYILWKNRGTWK